MNGNLLALTVHSTRDTGLEMAHFLCKHVTVLRSWGAPLGQKKNTVPWLTI